MAYSLYLFVRDIAEGDLSAGSINAWHPALTNAGKPPGTAYRAAAPRLRRLRQDIDHDALGALAWRLRRPSGWFETGKDMIAIDTLVHNFLHRTGILDDCGAQHGYGVGCYANGGCADIIQAIAAQIDARAFNASYPAYFRGLFNTRFGGIARPTASISATATVSMTKNHVKTAIANYSANVGVNH